MKVWKKGVVSVLLKPHCAWESPRILSKRRFSLRRSVRLCGSARKQAATRRCGCRSTNPSSCKRRPGANGTASEILPGAGAPPFPFSRPLWAASALGPPACSSACCHPAGDRPYSAGPRPRPQTGTPQPAGPSLEGSSLSTSHWPFGRSPILWDLRKYSFQT